MECRDEIQSDHSHQHTGDSASGTLQTRDQAEGTRDPDFRQRYETEVEKTNSQNDSVPRGNTEQPPLHRDLTRLYRFIDRFLNQRIVDDAEAEENEEKIEDAAGAVLVSVQLIDLLTHFIRPDIAVDATGH